MALSETKYSLPELLERLQLDPRFRGHQAEFDVVCWQHMHQHLSVGSDWFAKLRQGFTCFGDQFTAELDGQRHNDWNKKLNEIAYDFLATHGQHFWPAWWNPPADTPALQSLLGRQLSTQRSKGADPKMMVVYPSRDKTGNPTVCMYNTRRQEYCHFQAWAT